VNWNKIRNAVREKAEIIINQYIEQAVDKFYTDLRMKQ